MDSERPTDSEDLRCHRLFYEIYPTPTPGAANSENERFEMVLHFAVERRREPDDPESRRAFSVLMSLAEVLIQSVNSYAPYRLDMPAAYYTLHPSGRSAPPLLTRTISLVFSGIVPNKIPDRPGILAHLTAVLALQGVPPLQNAGARNASDGDRQ